VAHRLYIGQDARHPSTQTHGFAAGWGDDDAGHRVVFLQPDAGGEWISDAENKFNPDDQDDTLHPEIVLDLDPLRPKSLKAPTAAQKQNGGHGLTALADVRVRRGD